jgi:hypothetical protein
MKHRIQSLAGENSTAKIKGRGPHFSFRSPESMPVNHKKLDTPALAFYTQSTQKRVPI